MDIEEENNCNGIKRKKPSADDYEQLNPTVSCDDDRPPELEPTSKKKPDDVDSGKDLEENQTEDLELMWKSDREIVESIARLKRGLPSFCVRLPDGGEKFKANLRRHENELERRKKAELEKADNGCDEIIQLPEHSDDGALHGRRKSLSKFANLLCKKMEEDKDSRTVYAFEEDLSYVNPCHGQNLKSKSQTSGKGRSKTGLSSSRSLKSSLTGSKKHINSIDENKDGDFTTPVSVPNSPKDPPARNLRPRTARACHLVDEENVVEKFMQNMDPCLKDVKVYYPSRDYPDAVEVNYDYMACLAPEQYISSIIMNFYIQYLQQPSLSSEIATCHYHFFNTYFYNKLEKLSYKEDSFLKFRKWWKGVSLFEKAYILLPVHENSHWSLVIICFPDKEDELGPILLHLDSLGLHDSKSLFDNIKRFLKEEWNYLRKSKTLLDPPVKDEIWENLDSRVDHRKVMVPQQKNEYDCGLFVLFYMELFIKEAPVRFKKKDLSMFSKQWFRPQEASNLRAKIYDLLVEEFKKAKEKESTSSPKS